MTTRLGSMYLWGQDVGLVSLRYPDGAVDMLVVIDQSEHKRCVEEYKEAYIDALDTMRKTGEFIKDLGMPPAIPITFMSVH